MRRSLVALALTAGVAGALATAGAASASADGTPVSLTVTGAGISISQPAAVNLGNAVSGATPTGSLGTTTVTDLRSSLAGWTVSVAATSFTDTNTPADSIPVGAASVWIPALPTLVSGVAVPTTTYALQAAPLTLSASAQTLVTALTTGNNTVSFAPSIQVKVPAAAIAGTYTGTVTQTVS